MEIREQTRVVVEGGKHPRNSNGEKPLNLQRLPKLRVESGLCGGGPWGTVALRQSGREGGEVP